MKFKHKKKKEKLDPQEKAKKNWFKLIKKGWFK